MTYKLAKQLKEAGFPQEMKYGDLCFYNEKEYIHTGGGHREAGGRLEGFYYNKGQTCCNNDDNLHFISIYDDLVVKIPTLSELIEYCGYNFGALIYRFQDQNIGWVYECISGNTKTQGKTPKEAVVKLLLEINESERNTTIRKS